MSDKAGKFVSTFQSFQMISDYEGADTENNINDKNNSVDIKAQSKDEDIYNGDDLYNPLDMDSNDDEFNTQDTESSLDNSSVPQKEDEEEEEEQLCAKVSERDEFMLEKTPEKNDGSLIFIEDDELLGTALAELEEQEKEEVKEEEEKSKEDKGVKDSKKKKKRKEKNKDDKKKKKKKKRKKGKDKNKDKEKDGNDEHKEKKKLKRSSSEVVISKESENRHDKNKKEKDKEKGKEKDKHKKDKKKDKKQNRDISKERDERRRSTTKHSSKESDDKHKHSSSKKEKHTTDNHRKRIHRSPSPNPNHSSSKRSRHSDINERGTEDRDHKRKPSIKSPSSKDHRDRRHSTSRSKLDTNETKLPRHDNDKRSDKDRTSRDRTPKLLSKDEFDTMQKEAKKTELHVTRQQSSDSSHEEQQRLVIEDMDTEPTIQETVIPLNPVVNAFKYSSLNTTVFQHNIVIEQETEIEPLKEQDDSVVDFKRVENDMYDVAISSHSEAGSGKMVEPKKALKPGALSIDEYKERRKSGKDSRLSSSSQR